MRINEEICGDGVKLIIEKSHEILYTLIGKWNSPDKTRFRGKRIDYLNNKEEPFPSIVGEFVKINGFEADGLCTEYIGKNGRKIFFGFFREGSHIVGEKPCTFEYLDSIVSVSGNKAIWTNRETNEVEYEGEYIFKESILPLIKKHGKGKELNIKGVWKEDLKHGIFMDEKSNFKGYYNLGKLIIPQTEFNEYFSTNTLNLSTIIEYILSKIAKKEKNREEYLLEQIESNYIEEFLYDKNKLTVMNIIETKQYIFELIGSWINPNRFKGKKIVDGKEILIGEFLKDKNFKEDGFCIEYNQRGQKIFTGFKKEGFNDYTKNCTIYQDDQTIRINDPKICKIEDQKGNLIYQGGFININNKILKNGEGNEGSLFGIWKNNKKNGLFIQQNGEIFGYFQKDNLIVTQKELDVLDVNKILDIILSKIMV